MGGLPLVRDGSIVMLSGLGDGVEDGSPEEKLKEDIRWVLRGERVEQTVQPRSQPFILVVDGCAAFLFVELQSTARHVNASVHTWPYDRDELQIGKHIRKAEWIAGRAP